MTSHVVSLLYSASVHQKNKAPVMTAPVRAVNITRKEKEYRGMLAYREGDETRLVKKLVVGMRNLFYSLTILIIATKYFS